MRRILLALALLCPLAASAQTYGPQPAPIGSTTGTAGDGGLLAGVIASDNGKMTPFAVGTAINTAIPSIPTTTAVCGSGAAGMVAACGTIPGVFSTLSNAGVSQSPYAAAGQFGTGADGTVALSSGTTTLVRDMHYINLTPSATGKIVTNGYHIFVSNTLDLSLAQAGAISANGTAGGNAAGSVAGASAPGALGRMIPGSAAGTVGATGVVGTPVAANAATVTGALQGGSAGFTAATSPTGGAGTNPGSVGGLGQLNGSPQSFPTPTTAFATLSGGAALAGMAAGGSAAGGGAGGGDNTNPGGGGGGGPSGAGMVYIAARFIQRGTNTTVGIIQAKGALGGNGGIVAVGNTGGGAPANGSGGGFVWILTEALLGSVITNGIDVSGGAGGVGGNGFGSGLGSKGGNGGNGGSIQIIALSVPSFTANATNGSTGATAGGAPSGVTGGVSGTAATAQANL